MDDSIVSHILLLSIILVFSPYLARLFRLQTAPIEIIIGSILGYFGLIGAESEGAKYFDLIAEIGFLYLMFSRFGDKSKESKEDTQGVSNKGYSIYPHLNIFNASYR